jgi:hypothetical protein
VVAMAAVVAAVVAAAAVAIEEVTAEEVVEVEVGVHLVRIFAKSTGKRHFRHCLASTRISMSSM